MVKSSEERRDFWIMLKATAGVAPDGAGHRGDLEERPGGTWCAESPACCAWPEGGELADRPMGR